VLARNALRANGGGELTRSECLAHERDRLERALQHPRRGHAHDTPPEPSERPIGPRIGNRAPRVAAAIHLDDELG
jgi:hypothetical protein